MGICEEKAATNHCLTSKIEACKTGWNFHQLWQIYEAGSINKSAYSTTPPSALCHDSVYDFNDFNSNVYHMWPWTIERAVPSLRTASLRRHDLLKALSTVQLRYVPTLQSMQVSPRYSRVYREEMKIESFIAWLINLIF